MTPSQRTVWTDEALRLGRLVLVGPCVTANAVFRRHHGFLAVSGFTRWTRVARFRLGCALGRTERAGRAWLATNLVCVAKHPVLAGGAQRRATVKRGLRCLPEIARSAFGGPGTACVLARAAVDTVSRKIGGSTFVTMFATRTIKALIVFDSPR